MDHQREWPAKWRAISQNRIEMMLDERDSLERALAHMEHAHRHLCLAQAELHVDGDITPADELQQTIAQINRRLCSLKTSIAMARYAQRKRSARALEEA